MVSEAQRRAIFAKQREVKLSRAAQNRLMSKAELATVMSKQKGRGGDSPAPTVRIKPRPPGDAPSLASHRFPPEKVRSLPLMRAADIMLIRDPDARKALFARREGLSIDDPLISERGFNA
jgi:hypothetical protein